MKERKKWGPARIGFMVTLFVVCFLLILVKECKPKTPLERLDESLKDTTRRPSIFRDPE